MSVPNRCADGARALVDIHVGVRGLLGGLLGGLIGRRRFLHLRRLRLRLVEDGVHQILERLKENTRVFRPWNIEATGRNCQGSTTNSEPAGFRFCATRTPNGVVRDRPNPAPRSGNGETAPIVLSITISLSECATFQKLPISFFL